MFNYNKTNSIVFLISVNYKKSNKKNIFIFFFEFSAVSNKEYLNNFQANRCG